MTRRQAGDFNCFVIVCNCIVARRRAAKPVWKSELAPSKEACVLFATRKCIVRLDQVAVTQSVFCFQYILSHQDNLHRDLVGDYRRDSRDGPVLQEDNKV